MCNKILSLHYKSVITTKSIKETLKIRIFSNHCQDYIYRDFQKEISDMMYKIWYKVLLNGTSAGTILSCISFCGMVATIAVEMGIPVDNITKSLDVSLTVSENKSFVNVIFHAFHCTGGLVGNQHEKRQTAF